MAIVEPGKGRAIIEHNGAGLRITIPAQTYFITTAISALFVPFWVFGVIAATYKLVAEPLSFGTAFMTFWLTGWTLGGLWNLNVLLWNLAGKETIELEPATLTRRKQIPLFSRSREYAVASIKGLRLATPRLYRYYYQQDMSFLVFNDAGAISFDYGRDTHTQAGFRSRAGRRRSRGQGNVQARGIALLIGELSARRDVNGRRRAWPHHASAQHLPRGSGR